VPSLGTEPAEHDTTHRVTLEIVESFPEEIAAGAEIQLYLRVSCASGCRLNGAAVDVTTAEGSIISTTELPGEGAAGDAKLTLTAPRHAGSFAWVAAVRWHETEDGIHEASAPVALSFRTIPHETSMAVWDVPTPVVEQSLVRPKVGLRCSVGCNLAGRAVSVVDESGMPASTGILGSEPLSGTEALYWTGIELQAPAGEGVSAYRAEFSSGEIDLPHHPSSARFSFRTSARAEHEVTIAVLEKETGAPVNGVEVRLGPYIRSTDASGTVRIDVPGGEYDLSVRKDGLEAAPQTLHVASDLSIRIDGTVVATMAERAAALTSFEGYPWG
jgi:hypothetical protein